MTTRPDYAVSPGDHIEEWLDDHGLNAAELARRLDVTPKHVSELLSGKAPLSATVALGLERVTGIPARIWNRFEAGYREDLARLAETDRLVAQYDQAKHFPLAYLRKWQYISASAHDRAGTVRDLLSLFGIAHLDAFDATWVHGKVAYRKVTLATDLAIDKVYERATWLALGERAAEVESVGDFDRAGLDALIPQLRALTARPNPVEAVAEATELLGTVGVALCLIPPIPGFGVHGATRWIAGHPVVQLSVRGRTDDQLWFTLFHELGHVLLHGQKTVFLQGAGDQAETEADDFASSTLVPQQYHDRLPSGRNIAAVRDLAAELGIAPSIVLGQAQRATKDYAWGRQLRVTLVWDDTKESER
ncbi:ImmA/IrrE family metallo-endopeptidase [Propionibacterium freudenreichii]|uniref:ImmA/IrrE family metallo-endopeptidase n=1 Tax=Propionibacterium freudenreichii TaxID=1744 RepID=UPI00101EE07C|nr:ImmA/IrrE family metallo-endopeptidase [Propionibacterium freudenreichii]MCT2996640.1 ImmA/IrrE family metallo-endopeptidase [Propionibacterium freudenreichii]MDK9646768.1 ImmA/IrrE family metallo-endopeptidase [Propionibacterium freudenreichii]MDK9666692.1 ImmA/IrrE family metallo-endopeptidase [Propionibacterium freudenreichii]